MRRSSLLYILFTLFLFCFIGRSGYLYGQNEVRESKMVLDSLLRSDTLSVADSVSFSDTSDFVQPTTVADTVKGEGMLDYPVFSSARDSVIEDFSGVENKIYYYGDVSVTYGAMSIKAEYMEYNVDNQTVFACGLPDSQTGEIKGKPEMQEGDEKYSMETLHFNFKTQKARIKNMITQQADDGILHGENIKMMQDKSLNIMGGKYTVCDLDHPHYYLKMTTAKIITEPKQRTVFGPAYVVIEDVPLPIVLPFGFVPQTPSRSSGLLLPTFGEEASRGFYLKDMGYYMVFGDYLDLSATTSIFSLGSWNVNLNSRYKVRYKLSGSFGMTYSVDQTGEKGSTDFFQTKNFAVRWSHTQDPKANPGTSFSASVNFSSPSNSKYNAQSVSQALENQISSSISYSKTWERMSLSVNGLHSQNSRDSSYSITLPNLTFNLNRFNPFKRKVAVGKKRLYEDISFSYNASFQNRVNFKVSELKNPNFWGDKLKAGMNHRFTIGLPSFTLLKYLNFSPSVNYGMNWYFQDQRMEYNPETDRVETITSAQFSTFGLSQDFSAGLSMSTRIYGMFSPRKQTGSLKAVRHMITPSISFSFKPEMGTAANGYLTYNYVDTNGVAKSVDYNRWQGGINSPPSKGKTASMSFSFGNNLEAKIADPMDTTGTGTKKVKLIDNLRLGGSYNFLADSIKLSNINISGNTTLFEKIGVNGNLTLDPYAVDSRGRKYNQFNIVKTGRLFRMTNASASFSWSISGNGKGKGNDGMNGGSRGGDERRGEGGVKTSTAESFYNKIFYHPVTGEYIPGGWAYYLNPEVPWQLSLSYSYSYNKSYSYTNEQLMIKHNHTQTLTVNGQVRLTKDLNVNFNSGVDLSKMKLTTTQMSATYDLHCFAISVSWVPFGQWKSWSFRIAAKASALADILQYKKGSSFWDN